MLSHSEEEERFTKTRSEVRALIDIAFGGMVAEELFFGEASTGVASDLQSATLNACQMVGQLGMGKTLVSAAAMEYPAGGIVSKVLSNDGGREEVEELLADSKQSVTAMLAEHRHVVEALRDALLEREELIGDDIIDVIRTAQSIPPDDTVIHYPLGRIGRGVTVADAPPKAERAEAVGHGRGHHNAFQSSAESQPTGVTSGSRSTRTASKSIQVGWSKPARRHPRSSTAFQSRLFDPPSE